MIRLRDQFGKISLAEILPEEVAALDDTQQKILSLLISTVQEHELATERFTSAMTAYNAATKEEQEAMAAHLEASDPFPFSPHPDIQQITDTAKREAALREARKQHDDRVRLHREDEARRRSIASYNANH